MQDKLWKAAFNILEKVQHLPLADRQAVVEAETSDPQVIDMVAELLQEAERDTPPEAGPPQPGERFGRYRIDALLGKGGSGEVFSARDLELDRPVALKFLASHLLVQGAKATENLIREAKAASALNHPNIITVYDVARESETERIAIAMELVDGVGLRAHCTPGSPQPIERVIRWGRQIASVLTAAHAQQIVHRDIKPENVIVRNADDNIKVLDFGLAKRVVVGRESSHSLSPGGTIAYYSPEQVAGQKPTAASDVFALGVLLYELVTGRHPFPGDTPLDKLYAIAHQEPLPASAALGVDKLLAGMLAKDPAARPAAAAAEQVLAKIATQPSPASRGRRITIAAAAGVVLALGGYFGMSRFGGADRQSKVDSVAVLPFRVVDPSMDYLSDGLRHEIALGLAQTPGLRVAGYTKAAGSHADPKQAGMELGVAAVVTGAIGRTGKTVLLDLELLDARSGAQLWSGQFEQQDAGIATFPSAVAGRIAAKLGSRVVAPSRLAGAVRNPDAYEAYLRARYHYNKRTKQDMALASSHCERAVQLDPKFAEAWSLLAASQGFTPGMYNSLSPQQLYAKMQAAIAKAIEIDPDLPEVHVTLGGMKFFQERDWAVAEQEFRRAIALNPNDGQAHFFLAILLRVLGRGGEERATIRRARELDPLSPLVANHVAWTEYFGGSDPAAEVELQKAMALDGKFSPNQTLLGYIRLHQHRFPEAISAFQKATETAAGQARGLGDLGYAYAVSGDRSNAERILRNLQTGQSGYVPAGTVAWVHMGLGNKDQAFTWFAKAGDENYQWLNYIRIWSVYDALRDDPRMAALLQRLKLAQAPSPLSQ